MIAGQGLHAHKIKKTKSKNFPNVGIGGGHAPWKHKRYKDVKVHWPCSWLAYGLLKVLSNDEIGLNAYFRKNNSS